MLFYLTGRDSKYKSRADNSFCKRGALNGYVFKRGSDIPRHIALNVKNQKTIEFRMFKTSASASVIKSYIEFVDLAIKFVGVNGINSCTMRNFIEYLIKNAKSRPTRIKLNVIKKDLVDLSTLWIDDYTELYSVVDRIPWQRQYKILALASGTFNKAVLLDIAKKIAENKLPDRGMKGVKLGIKHPVYRHIESNIMNGLCKA